MLKKIRNIINEENIFIIYIIIIFFLYFIISDSLDIVIPLYFSNQNINIVLYGILVSITKVVRSVIVIPISTQTVKNKMRILKTNILIDMIILFLLIYIQNIIVAFIGFCILIVTTSVINVILNPLLGTNCDKNKIGIVFGIRDTFLYLGCFFGFLIVGRIKAISQEANSVWIFYLIIYVLIFLVVNRISKNIEKKDFVKEKSDTHEKKEKKKKISKELLFYLMILFILGASGAYSTYLPMIAMNVGIQEDRIFYIFSSSTFIAAILAITGGITIDKYNKKKLFQFDIILFIGILILFCFNNKHIFILAIVISGLSSALDNVANSYVFANYSEEEVNRFWGIIGSVSLISFSIGSVLCGILYEINYRYIFAFSIILNIIGFLMSTKMKNIEKKIEEKQNE